MLILGVFLLALAAGVMSTAFWVPEDDLGRGYFQTNALIVLGLLAIVMVMVGTGSIRLWSGGVSDSALLIVALVAATAVYVCVWRENWIAGRWASALCLAALALALWRVDFNGRYQPSVEALTGITLWLSALVLGWSMITMLLGHWYLVVPKLDFRHLKTFCSVLTVLLVVRAAASALGMVVAGRAADPANWTALVSVSGWGMFLWVRVLWGLVGALLLSVMALHCARRGSNQSATGILYVVVVSVWIGEGTALFLQAMTGVAI